MGGMCVARFFPRRATESELQSYADAVVEDGWLSPEDWVDLFQAFNVGGSGYPCVAVYVSPRAPSAEMVAILERLFAEYQDAMSPFTRAFASLYLALQKDLLAENFRMPWLEDLQPILDAIDPSDPERWEVRSALKWIRMTSATGDTQVKLGDAIAKRIDRAPLKQDVATQVSVRRGQGALAAPDLLDAFETYSLDGSVDVDEVMALNDELDGDLWGPDGGDERDADVLTPAAERLRTVANTAARALFVEDAVVDRFVEAFFMEEVDPTARRRSIDSFLKVFGSVMSEGKVRELRQRVGRSPEHPLKELSRAARKAPWDDARPRLGLKAVSEYAAAGPEQARLWMLALTRADGAEFSPGARVAAQLLQKVSNGLLISSADVNRLIAISDRSPEDIAAMRELQKAWADRFENEAAAAALEAFIAQGGQDPSCAEGPLTPEVAGSCTEASELD
jgi:hypothetical protein